ncbi:MAG: 6-carboxytetrahydropterin synthase [Bacteroidales bacterium]|jgi:6-pyruvoyltetrahydropterin/6-carboxytetrahydropterin synthase|nr:6-carboxytetrahydropterin synthase [Bacteroidales bacterium]HOM36078.1 6-carboxytetrahydropterin synthase [Bacteroidales bacterium]HPD22913.1 6-carboxytetrahydropterin synthase [Bacteroidales bacterium]HRS98581.1 6-carboxytetrahydropterin synthase [Bacteroidales bacterium]HRT79642.1 6-carboxytetrahydropterin synthase [Bacteroidales bacterium]
MVKIRVTKIFDFETAHALHNYDGLCRNVHGHSYKLYVTVMGEPENNDKSTKFGMVIDFGNLKKIVKENIVDVFDHSLIISNKEDIKDLLKQNILFKRLHIFDFQPTAENLIIYFSNIIIPLLPDGIKLVSLRLYETANSYAEWYAEDQE